MRRASVACVVALTAAGCGPSDRAAAVAENVRVVDSTQAPGWNLMEDSSTIYRVEARGAAGVRVVDSVLAPLPILVGDSLLVGLSLTVTGAGRDQEGLRRLFRYHLASGRVETFELPDVWYVAFDVLPSPDGRYVAYVADDSARGGTHAAVREIASGAVIVRGPGGGGCDCDVDANHVRWFAPDSFEIAVAHTASDSGGWQRVSGRASARRFRIDTLRSEPDWHK